MFWIDYYKGLYIGHFEDKYQCSVIVGSYSKFNYKYWTNKEIQRNTAIDSNVLSFLVSFYQGFE